MIEIVRKGARDGDARLESDAALTPTDFADGFSGIPPRSLPIAA
jgi:hypothetical protein